MDPPPCACRGTMGGMHLSCLTQWVRSSGRLNCNTCQTQYSIASDHTAKLFESTATLVSLHAGCFWALVLIYIVTTFKSCIYGTELTFPLDPTTVCLELSCMLIGRAMGHLLTRGFTKGGQHEQGADGLVEPLLPFAFLEVIGAALPYTNPVQRQARREVAQATRPLIGAAICVLCCCVFAIATYAFGCASADGLACLCCVWLFLGGSFRVTRLHAERHVQHGAVGRGLVSIMTNLCAAQAGCFWSIIFITFVISVLCRWAVKLRLDLCFLLFYLVSFALGTILGCILTNWCAPDAEGPDELAEPMLPGVGEEMWNRIMRRVQHARAARAQLTRAVQTKTAFCCFASCFFIFLAMVCIGYTMATGLLVITTLWVIIVSSCNVAWRCLRAGWYLHVVPPEVS